MMEDRTNHWPNAITNTTHSIATAFIFILLVIKSFHFLLPPSIDARERRMPTSVKRENTPDHKTEKRL